MTYIYHVLLKLISLTRRRNSALPEVSDADDDEQVKSDSEQGDGGQHKVKQRVLGATWRGLPARRVVQQGEAGIESFSEGLHWLREQRVQGLVISCCIQS